MLEIGSGVVKHSLAVWAQEVFGELFLILHSVY